MYPARQFNHTNHRRACRQLWICAALITGEPPQFCVFICRQSSRASGVFHLALRSNSVSGSSNTTPSPHPSLSNNPPPPFPTSPSPPHLSSPLHLRVLRCPDKSASRTISVSRVVSDSLAGNSWSAKLRLPGAGLDLGMIA